VAVVAELSWTPRGLDARISGAITAYGENSMDIEQTAAEPVVVDPFASVIDTIQITVSVELARRRIALTELLNTQEGSVLEFGAPVSTDVTLMIDGSPFARGEIVSIDDRVGVRVVSLGGRR
jgi:flagellar motor switch protein FliN/FliY